MSSSHAGQADVPTHFLTCHGTVVRVERATKRLIHAAVWPERALAIDWRMSLPAGGVTAPVASPADAQLVVEPGRLPRLVHVRHEADYLCADVRIGEVRFSRQSAGVWETFLLLTEAQLGSLREILGASWVPPGGAGIACVPALASDFMLQVGAATIDLRHHVPMVGRGDSVFSDAKGGVFQRAGARISAVETMLTRRAPAQQAPEVADDAAFRVAENARLTVRGGIEYGFEPLAVNNADADWMMRNWTQPGERRLGQLRNAVKLVRERDKFVMLARRHEGLIFDAAGASNETGYLMDYVHVGATGMLTREGDHVFMATENLADVPRLAGPHAVFYGAHISNYYHWLVDGLLPLHVMRPFLPAGTKLLIPGSFRQFRVGEMAARHVDHMAALRDWGFGDMPTVEIDAPVCHVEEVFWLDECFIDRMPARLVAGARDDVLARLGPANPSSPDKPRGIYITRENTRFVENAAAIEKVMTNNGFTTHAMEGMTPRAQMELFRDTDFVVAPHGAALANLLFCREGTKVLELSPSAEFRPLFAQISDKLGLTHGVLQCPTHDGGFNGRMNVDVNKFRMLLKQMQLRA